MKAVKGGQWVVEKLAENIPLMMGTIVTGGGAGLAAAGTKIGQKARGWMTGSLIKRELARQTLKAAGKQLTGTAVKNMAKKIALSNVPKEAIEIAQKEALKTIGSRIGLVGSMGAAEAGGMFGELSERGIDDREAALKSLGFGLAAGLVELAGGLGPNILNRLFGKKKAGTVSRLIDKATRKLRDGKPAKDEIKLMSRIWREAADNAPQEFAQEGVQEVLSLLNIASNDPNFEGFTKENINRVIESAVAGGGVGALLGGGMGAITSSQAAIEKYRNTNGLDEQANKEVIDRLSEELDQEGQPADEVAITGEGATAEPLAEGGAGVSPDELGEQPKQGVDQAPQTKQPEPLEEPQPIETLEGEYVNYGGIKGFLRKTDDGYVVITPDRDVLVESGEAGIPTADIGIQKEPSPLIETVRGVPQKKRILDKFGAYDPRNETLVRKDGSEYRLIGFNRDKEGDIASATFEDKDGNERVFRDKSLAKYIERVQSLYNEVNYGEERNVSDDQILRNEAEGSDWHKEAAQIDAEIQKEIAAKPREELEFDMYYELANGGWLENISDDEAIEIADDIGVPVENKSTQDIINGIRTKATKWLELWDTFDSVESVKPLKYQGIKSTKEQKKLLDLPDVSKYDIDNIVVSVPSGKSGQVSQETAATAIENINSKVDAMYEIAGCIGIKIG
ncbi:MAG: hypothetical protein DRG69_09005 [Deltaproteobacteria bacterium]|nr:MAG: hypothetical protein DRG69_09005 [Deltaproteobacteria bacterium]